MPSSEPSAADQQLIDHAQRHGYTVTAKQLAIWRRAGLMPGNIPGGGLGRGKGSTSQPAPESFDLVLGLARHAGPGKRPTDLALLLFAEGLPVPEATVRAAFRAAVDTVTIPGEDDDPDEEPDDRLDNFADHLAESGQAMTLVPARARRIDEQIARLARDAGETWPPPELASWDENPEPSPSTPQDATLTAASAVLTGSLSLEEIGDMLRAMNPGAAANPIASLVETTQNDVPDIADKVLGPDGTLALGPVGDARDLLRDLTDRAPLEGLAAAWQTVQRVREWALDLCVRVESELDAGQRGEAVAEWQISRYLGAGMAILSTLRDRRWPPAQRALDTMLVLYQLHEFRLLDRILPGCQWHLLKSEGVMPPPVRDLLKDLIDKDSAPAEPAPE
ncbi:hypothetical protein HRW14_07380 [Streptomyces lunaelactis]|uniref:hypothetical protein n=1 Tax=Streptomyces lunaelactis TaxID=1535768 RepID=UPI001584BFC8|nr:hypothetical protein [Streptomyces lunaelactis]NUK50121.1 hypothetical protein [Streptomyces lunaelactis]